ncbi:hypothetical protein EMIT0P171_40229 [Pseudomonas sp. IT-P171]
MNEREQDLYQSYLEMKNSFNLMIHMNYSHLVDHCLSVLLSGFPNMFVICVRLSEKGYVCC